MRKKPRVAAANAAANAAARGGNRARCKLRPWGLVTCEDSSKKRRDRPTRLPSSSLGWEWCGCRSVCRWLGWSVARSLRRSSELFMSQRSLLWIRAVLGYLATAKATALAAAAKTTTQAPSPSANYVRPKWLSPPQVQLFSNISQERTNLRSAADAPRLTSTYVCYEQALQNFGLDFTASLRPCAFTQRS